MNTAVLVSGKALAADFYGQITRGWRGVDLIPTRSASEAETAEFLAGASGWYDHEPQFLAGASGWYDHEPQKLLTQQTANPGSAWYPEF